MSLKRHSAQTVVTQNDFYQDGYPKVIQIAILQFVIIILLAASLVAIFLLNKTQYRFFATTSDGRIIDIVPLNDPYRGDIVPWVSQAATESMTFAFTDYRMRLQSSSKFFTLRGWQTFVDALTKSKVLEAVDKRHLNVRGNPTAAPQIKRQGVVNGIYQWILEMPYRIEYSGGKELGKPISGLLTLTVQRMPNIENPQGVGIDQWIMTLRE